MLRAVERALLAGRVGQSSPEISSERRPSSEMPAACELAREMVLGIVMVFFGSSSKSWIPQVCSPCLEPE